MSQDYRTIQYSFIGGLLSPMQEGSVSTNAYQQGLSIAENVLYGPGYGIMKRHGTQYQGYAYTNSVIYPFQYKGNVYGVEFGEKKARLITYSSYEDGGVASFGSDVETPYTVNQAHDLSVVSNLDYLYLVHHSFKPRKMTISNGSLTAPSIIDFKQSVTPSSPSEGDFKTTAVTFDEEGDYPSRQIFYGGRWFLMATDNQPQTIWFSRSYDSETASYRFEDFTISMQVYRQVATDTFEYEDLELADLAGVYLNSDLHGSNIRWVIAHQNMLISTGSAIYSNGGEKTVSAVVSENATVFNLTPALSYGSTGREAFSLGSFVFFPGVDNRSVRCIAYNQTYNSYAGSDISQAVSQYLANGIRRMCVTDGQMPILWVLSNDNDLLACYFDSGQVIAWSRICFNGDDHPVWISPVSGSENGYCALSLIMARGNGRFVETLEIISPATIWRYPQVDCWQKKTSGATYIGHEGEYASRIITDGNGKIRMLSQKIDADATYTVPQSNIHYVGYPYTMVAGTLRTELPANGTSQGARRAVTSVTLRLFNSIGGSIALRPEMDDSFYPYRKASDLIAESKPMLYRVYNKSLYGEAYELFTGDKSTQFNTKVLDDDRIVVVAEEPFPFCICAIIVKHSITEA